MEWDAMAGTHMCVIGTGLTRRPAIHTGNAIEVWGSAAGHCPRVRGSVQFGSRHIQTGHCERGRRHNGHENNRL